MDHKEIEVRFLEINKNELVEKLIELGAEDKGEDMLEEVIVYDKDLIWKDEGGKLLKLRTRNGKTVLTYKHHIEHTAEGTEEIEVGVSDTKSMELLLERIGYVGYRHQQKYRHTFVLDGVTFDIDTWPRIPTYVELEGESENSLKAVAQKVGLDWNKVVFENPRIVIEKIYNIPVGNMRWFTFDKFE